MKGRSFLIALHFLALIVKGQNLVPNGGFEDSVICSSNPNTMHPSLWFPPSQGSPDYFFQSSSAGCVLSQTFWGGGQDGLFGIQSPHSGIHYAGFASSYISNEREYLEIRLSDSLIAGKKYSIEFFVSLAESSGYACDGLGISLNHDSTVDFSNYAPINSLVCNGGNPIGNILFDSVNWVPIRDTFIANGGERYLVLGDVRSNAQTNFVQVNSSSAYAYYFVDDVSLTDLGWTGIAQYQNPFAISVFPNPSNGELNLKGSFSEKSELRVYDLIGNEVIDPITLPEGDRVTPLLLQLSCGVYFYRVISKSEVLREDRLVIVR